MVFLAMFIFAGAATAAATRMAPILMVSAVALPIGYLLVGVQWLNDRAGVSDFLLDSWSFVSGVQYPAPIIKDTEQYCRDYGLDGATTFLVGFVYYIVLLILMIFTTIVGLICIVGTLPAVVISAVSGVYAAIVREADAFIATFGIVAMWAGAVIGTGLLIRLAHFLSGVGPCAM